MQKINVLRHHDISYIDDRFSWILKTIELLINTVVSP